jgi:beta-glucanase (GH16 family)
VTRRTSALAVAALTAGLLPLGTSAPADAARPQSVALKISPGIVQNGRSVADPDDAFLVGIATLRPVRKGRFVLVQRRVRGGQWSTVRRARESATGRVRFREDARRGLKPYLYRVVATKSRDGLPKVASRAQSAASWRLWFSDRFNGGSLNRDKWDYRQLGIRAGSRMHAQSNRSAVRVRRGAVSLQVRKHPQRPRRYYLNGHIGTSGKFAFRYGYAAARIKFPEGRGQHGAFWMQPQSATARYGSAARTGSEIDIAEFFGRGTPRGGLGSYVYHYPRPNTVAKSGRVFATASRALRGRSDRWWSRYHVFSVRWTPTGLIFRVDGVEIWRHSRHVSRRPQYLILSLLTSDWELPRLDRSTLPTSMKVDWVRVWKK